MKFNSEYYLSVFADLDIEFYVYEHFTELCVLQTLFIIYAKIMRQKIQLALLVSIFGFGSLLAQESKIIHDAEQAILQEQFGEQWATQDVESYLVNCRVKLLVQCLEEISVFLVNQFSIIQFPALIKERLKMTI